MSEKLLRPTGEAMCEITLSTGKTIYANNRILGIDEDLKITEGYDGPIMVTDVLENAPFLTNAECREIADIAIARWQRFREKYKD